MARVLLIALPNSYRTGAYVAAARRLGLDLLLASEGQHSLASLWAEGLHVDLGAPEALSRLLAEAEREPFAAVVASDDATVELASRVAASLGLAHNPVASARLSRRKDLARARLAERGLPVPGFRLFDLQRDPAPQIEGLRFPCVVKPLALSASRGVIRVDAPAALLAALRRVARIVAESPEGEARRWLLLEDYLPGTEVALEGMLSGGRLSVLALFDKPDPLEGPYFEETYYVTPSRLRAEDQARIRRRVAEACAAYGLREGPVHAELRLHRGEAWILEVASRTIGGQCGRLLRFGAGVGLEELVLAHAVGRPLVPDLGSQAAGVLMIPTPRAGVLRRVEGVLAAAKVPLVEDIEISVREGYELVPLPEGSSYLGFIFARGASPEAVERALREAHGRLRVVTAPLLAAGVIA